MDPVTDHSTGGGCGSERGLSTGNGGSAGDPHPGSIGSARGGMSGQVEGVGNFMPLRCNSARLHRSMPISFKVYVNFAKILGIELFPSRSMAILTILEFPDERLRKKASPVEVFDASLRQLVADMLETMYKAPGIGLAATQVNVHKRVIVIDISEEKNAPVYLVNPEIIDKRGMEEMEEGCLSVPGIFEKVKRAQSVRVRALDVDGNTTEFDAEGLLAVCIQHELDHLEGHLFVDRLSPLKRQLVRKKIRKDQRHRPVKSPSQPVSSVI